MTDGTTVKTVSNHTLYAKWESNTYVVSFDAGEGTVSPSTQTKRYDSAYGKMRTERMRRFLCLFVKATPSWDGMMDRAARATW